MSNKQYIELVGLIEHRALIILESYLPTTHAVRSAEVSKFYSSIKVFIGNWGMSETIAYVKSSRVAVLRTLTGSPLDTSSEGRVPLSGGWPIWLAAWKIDLPSDRTVTGSQIEEIRYLLTLLSSLRSIMVPPVADTEPITKPYGGSIIDISDDDLRKVMFKLGVGRHTGTQVCWSKFHFTTKSGPNGPALLSSTREFGYAINTFGPELKTLGGSSFAQLCDELQGKLVTDESVILGKLAYFSDKEGKTRLVAMCDYWTQTVLKPIHDHLMSVLSKLPTDYTFNHSEAISYLLNLLGPYYSLDLSNATDRMPFFLQKKIMSYIIGTEKAQAWARLLTGRDYTLRTGKQRSAVINLRYAAGQPMGAYSSWASMAFTHHFIIQWAAMLVGHGPEKGMFKKYVVLGDDVVIADSTVAESYKRLLLSLDMPYSKAKTHVSQDSFEFAKRWVMFRKEVTPFSIGGLDRVMGRYSLLFSFLTNQATHGYAHTCSNSEFDMVSKLIEFEMKYVDKRRLSKKDKQRIHASRLLLYKLFYYLQHHRALVENLGKKWPSGLRLLRDAVANPGFYQGFLNLWAELGVSVDVFRKFYLPSFITRVVEVARRQIIERDLRDFQKSLPETLKRATSIDPRILSPGVDAGVVLHWLPPINCLAHIFQRSIEALASPSILFEDGIAKFFIGKGVLSVDRSTSTVIAESAVLKRSGRVLQSYGKSLEAGNIQILGDRLPSTVRMPPTILTPTIRGVPLEFALIEETPPIVGSRTTIYPNQLWGIWMEGRLSSAGKVAENPAFILEKLRRTPRSPPGNVPGTTNRIVVPEIGARLG